MDKKLTLKLSEDVIENVKRYADTHGTSVSKLAEAFFESLYVPQDLELDEDLKRIILSPAPHTDNPREEYRDAVMRRYQ